jgi:4-amino-4-deoxy-L-arabinose transferase-like glycosyltransferase
LNSRVDDEKPSVSRPSNLNRQIVFDGTATPVKTALFLIICAAWILPGLTGHDPWKPDEALAMGVVHTMLHLSSWHSWLVPQVGGVIHADYAPLYYWVSALTAKLTEGLLPAHDGARLASGLFMALTFLYLYKAANKLFDPRAGRIAVALLIGSLGLLLRAHEMSPEVAALAGMAIATYGLTRIRFEARKGGLTAGSGAAVIALSIGLVPALIVPLAAWAMMWLLHDQQNRAFRRGVLIALGVVLTASALHATALWLVVGDAAMEHLVIAVMGLPEAAAIQPIYLASILPWYALPTLPLAAWLWRKDRAILRERIELALPLSTFLVAFLWLSLVREARDAVGMLLLIPLALAGAYALDRLPKGVASFVDWFGLVFFGVAAVALWLYWSAALLGAPEGAARAVARAAPGFALRFEWFPFLVAATLSAVWAYAVAMAHRNNRRAFVNWAAGITLLWMLLNLLGLPAVDHVRSYRQPVLAIAGHVNVAPSCIIGTNLGMPQRAMFDYFASLRFVPANAAPANECAWQLVQGSKLAAPDMPTPWQLAWEGARPAERVEQFRLYRRAVPAR